MKFYVGSKIHDIRVTDKSLRYLGSVSISANIMRAAAIEPYEKVLVVNLNNGARWETYALPLEEPGHFTLNGGGARLGEIGDTCVVLTFEGKDSFEGARVVFCDENNKIVREDKYKKL